MEFAKREQLLWPVQERRVWETIRTLKTKILWSPYQVGEKKNWKEIIDNILITTREEGMKNAFG